MGLINLEPHQINCYKRSLELLKTHHAIINTSPPGTGKTFTSMAVAITYNFHMFIVAPANACYMWEEETAKYKIESTVISYGVLIGRNNKFSHPFLEKINDEYSATKEFDNLVTRRILLVFDESQDSKNFKTSTCKACHALSNRVVSINNGSKIMLLSGTLVDKEEFIESVLKLTGIIRSNLLFKHNIGKREYQFDGMGYQQLMDYCYKLNPEETRKYRQDKIKINSKLIKQNMYKLFVDVIRPNLGVTMPPCKMNAKLITISKFYKLNDIDSKKLEDALSKLKSEINYRPDGTIEYKQNGGNQIVHLLKHIELSKINLFTRLIEDTLNYVKNSKVLIFVWYDVTVDYLMGKFSEYSPLRCDGKVSKKKKEENRRLFQEYNANHRLLIAKPTSFGRSVSLHDTHGDFPRFTFINPHFYFNHIMQTTGRAYRVGTKSDSNVTLTYIQNTDEKNVILALSRKSEVTRSCIAHVYKEDGITIDDDIDENGDIPEGLPFVDRWNNEFE